MPGPWAGRLNNISVSVRKRRARREKPQNFSNERHRRTEEGTLKRTEAYKKSEKEGTFHTRETLPANRDVLQTRAPWGIGEMTTPTETLCSRGKQPRSTQSITPTMRGATQ